MVCNVALDSEAWKVTAVLRHKANYKNMPPAGSAKQPPTRFLHIENAFVWKWWQQPGKAVTYGWIYSCESNQSALFSLWGKQEFIMGWVYMSYITAVSFKQHNVCSLVVRTLKWNPCLVSFKTKDFISSDVISQSLKLLIIYSSFKQHCSLLSAFTQHFYMLL